MTTHRHRLLARQLRKTLGDQPSDRAPLAELLDLVDATYRQTDEERALLEHSMDTVSAELDDRFQRLQRALSESREQEKTLAGTLSLLRSIVDSTEDGLLVVDLRGHIELFNRRFAQLWQIPASALEPADDDAALAFVLRQLAEPELFLAKVKALYAEPEAESFDLVRFKDGRLFERFSMPHRIQGVIVGRVWSFRDISKRTRLEEQLRQSQKMEAVGHLAGGVAHDFNNLLTVIFGHAELLEHSLAESPAQLEELHQISEAAGRAARLTRQLLAFSRRQILEPQVVDLNAALRDVDGMLGRLIRENVTIRLKLEPDLGGILVDQGQLEQMILNLAVNARDAMPAGGTLTFSTQTVDATLDSTWGEPGDERAAWIALEVADSGAGMPEEVRTRIFEPFFTTKPEGEGTGLGLAMVYGFLQQSGGRIAVDSQVGRGTRFRIYFPRVELATSKPHPQAPRAAVGVETVLVVEDEPHLRQIACRALELRGYTVHAAGDAVEAMRLAREIESPIDLLFTDVVMPGGGGAALSRELCQLHPETRVLFTSGYTDDDVIRQGVHTATVRFLEKPFTLERLATSVRDALDATPELAPPALLNAD